ncbi:hypothetical protein [Streptomyces telluris]|uniref:Uncharacterized protein n=1 Tax=Streptomyces telluris TaxID=2720021 RepID=A0A9X2LLF5_9ACTN|nr:hypothetical protein [Streptomyces telluris]MCQ8771980.1 hypothetical protein [Streptomyces telluris]NJP78932.1 hypothetical protein [Streptomyces telluris]
MTTTHRPRRPRRPQRPRTATIHAALGALLLGALCTTAGPGTTPAAAAPALGTARTAPAAATLSTVTGTAAAPDRTALAGTALSCSLQTAPGDPLVFRPPVTGRVQQVSATGTVLLDRCTSADGSQYGIRSGRMVLRGSATANCLTAARPEGSAVITWYHGWAQRGRTAGTSHLRPSARGGGGYTPADTFLSGDVVSGRMAHRHVRGWAVPTTDVTACAARGLRTVAGRGNISFS